MQTRVAAATDEMDEDDGGVDDIVGGLGGLSLAKVVSKAAAKIKAKAKSI